MHPAAILAIAGGAVLLLRSRGKAAGENISSALPKPDVFPAGWDVVWQQSVSTTAYSYAAKILRLRAPDDEAAFVYAVKGHNTSGATADGWVTTLTRAEADAGLGELLAELKSNVA